MMKSNIDDVFEVEWTVKSRRNLQEMNTPENGRQQVTAIGDYRISSRPSPPSRPFTDPSFPGDITFTIALWFPNLGNVPSLQNFLASLAEEISTLLKNAADVRPLGGSICMFENCRHHGLVRHWDLSRNLTQTSVFLTINLPSNSEQTTSNFIMFAL